MIEKHTLEFAFYFQSTKPKNLHTSFAKEKDDLNFSNILFVNKLVNEANTKHFMPIARTEKNINQILFSVKYNIFCCKYGGKLFTEHFLVIFRKNTKLQNQLNNKFNLFV